MKILKKELYNKENKTINDKLEYRIKLCENENYDHIDLSNLENNLINAFFITDFYLKNCHKIKHLFMSNSNIYIIPDLSKMINLETIDLSHNNIDEIPTNFPKSVTELILNNNFIKSIEIDLNNLIRLDCSNNKLRKINNLNNIEKLDISKNDIYTMEDEYKKLIDLNCEHTKIIQLPNLPAVEKINCSNTKISHIFDCMKLKILVCNNCNLHLLERIPMLETLECINTKLQDLNYFPNLKLILLNKLDISLSKEYKILNALKNNKNIFEIKL